MCVCEREGMYVKVCVCVAWYVVGHPLMMQWVVGSIRHCGPIELFLVPAGGKCCLVCGVVYVNDPLLLIKKKIAHISEWSFAILLSYMTLYSNK